MIFEQPENKNYMEKDWIEGLSLPALFGLKTHVVVTAAPASSRPWSIPSVTVHANHLVKKPCIGLLEACHMIPPVWKLGSNI
jgi:hypothetical protein